MRIYVTWVGTVPLDLSIQETETVSYSHVGKIVLHVFIAQVGNILHFSSPRSEKFYSLPPNATKYFNPLTHGSKTQPKTMAQGLEDHEQQQL